MVRLWLGGCASPLFRDVLAGTRLIDGFEMFKSFIEKSKVNLASLIVFLMVLMSQYLN